MRPLAAAVCAPAVAPAAAGAPAAGRVPGCRPAQLRAELGPPVSEATGRHTLVLRLVNRGPACSLDGYPAIRLADAAGVVPFGFRHGGDPMLAARPPRRFRVARGGAAYVVADRYRCDRGDLRSATRARIGIPGSGARGLDVRLPRGAAVAWCGRGDPGSIVTVAPLVPTVAAALRGRASPPRAIVARWRSRPPRTWGSSS